MDNKQKQQIVLDIRKKYTDIISRWCQIEGACLLWSWAVYKELKDRHLKIRLTAGSASWPKIDMNKDDGKILTHFSYKFELEAAIFHLAQNRFPELHVWCELDNEVIDITTGYQKSRYEQFVTAIAAPEMKDKVGWTGKELPDYLWGPIPKDWFYESDKNAEKVAFSFLDSFLVANRLKI